MTMDSEHYWSREAERFDRIYAADEGKVRGPLNKLMRGDMEGRFRFALRHALEMPSPEILDVGCGTGVYTAALLRHGARFVTGVDLSERMLDRARLRLEDFSGRFELIRGDFMSTDLNRMYDTILIVGVFDYIAAPLPFLRRAAGLTRGTVIATFPRAGTFRAWLRRARLTLKGCPVYFQTRSGIEALAATCGFVLKDYELIGQLHCVVLERA